MRIVMCGSCGQQNRLTLKAQAVLRKIEDGDDEGKAVNCGACHESIVDLALDDDTDDDDDLDDDEEENDDEDDRDVDDGDD